MNSLVNRANRQVTHIKNDLSSLREALDSNSPNSTTLISKNEYFIYTLTLFSGQLSASLSGLQGTIRDLETMTRNETDPSKREEFRE